MGNKFNGFVFRVVNQYTLLVDMPYDTSKGDNIFQFANDGGDILDIAQTLCCQKVVVRDGRGYHIREFDGKNWVDIDE